MIFVDCHCDTAGVLCDRNQSIYGNGLSVDAEQALKAGDWLQFYASFAHAKYCRGREITRAVNILDKALNEFDANPQYVKQCFCYDDILRAFKEKKMAAMLSLESMECLQGSLAMLRTYYRIGVRMGSFTWNYRNELADGVLDGESGGGITAFGRDVLEEMNRLGMIVDVSHISDAGFWDMIRYSKAPIIASHSDSRAVTNHPRNLTDEMLKALADKGGCAGVNFWGAMLAGEENACSANIENIVAHIEHMKNVAGEDGVCLGSDYDGIEDEELPTDVRGIKDTHKIIEALEMRGHSASFIEKFAGLNMMRVIKEVIG